MDTAVRDRFLALWKKYFNNSELPVTFYYTDEEGHGETVQPGSVERCVIGALANVRKGKSLCFDVDGVGCPGGRRYLGFNQTLMPEFDYFLSCGIPGKLEGERYKKTPEMVKEYMEKHVPAFEAPGKYIVFKRWDRLEAPDTPEVVICFAEPDVLSGLFTLASFDEAEQNTVIAPFGSGCSSIVMYPYMEKNATRPRSVIGMFDISARPFVPPNVLTFSTPFGRFIEMMDNMEESFLITPSWAKIQQRIR